MCFAIWTFRSLNITICDYRLSNTICSFNYIFLILQSNKFLIKFGRQRRKKEKLNVKIY